MVMIINQKEKKIVIKTEFVTIAPHNSIVEIRAVITSTEFGTQHG